MTDKTRDEALNIRKLMREAEAVSDEAMVACARLKQAMILARLRSDTEVDTGQRALMRLIHAEQQALSLSTNLLRVHDELSKVAREKMGSDGSLDTPIEAHAIAPDIRASVAS
jgi:hypothetical protein